jgi:HPt (histidine-containing phosphotransfer) domain-containing protein
MKKETANAFNDPWLLDFLPDFFNRSSDNMSQLEAAVSKKNFGQMVNLGNRLKGVSGVFGFSDLYNIGDLIEVYAKQEDIEKVGFFTQQFKYHLDQLRDDSEQLSLF